MTEMDDAVFWYVNCALLPVMGKDDSTVLYEGTALKSFGPSWISG